MPQIELTIRPRAAGRLPAAAWFIPGDSPLEWVEEVVRWGVDQRSLRFIAVRAPDNKRIAGVLAIPGEPPTNSSDSGPGGRCVAYGRLGENVYLPADAELCPAVAPAEAFLDGYLYVWSPAYGLTAAAPSEMLSVADLIEAPAPVGDAWDSAVPGVGFPAHIVAILPEMDLTADGLLDDARDGIGDQSADLDKLPKTPGESLWIDGAAAIGAAFSAARDALRKLVGGLPTPPLSTRAGPLSRGAWALGEWLARFEGSLQAARNKEVTRLLNLLENDPDQGLKFALPMGGLGGAHRGRAKPGARLGTRSTDFNLRRLGGGGPADVWDLPPDYQRQLLDKYRELAAREVRLGRYRRAAYIYAELLGDLSAAASTLEQGACFREAAVLYRDRLKNPQAAAQCLERGELWAEAIHAYRDLGQHEKVGDLLTHIEQHAEAAEAYDAAAAAHLAAGRRLDAARVCDEKLRDHDRAIATLDEGWPASPQAGKCIQLALALRGRLGRHAATRQRIGELEHDAQRLARHADVAHCLVGVFEQYPDPTLRNHAAQTCRKIIADRMREAASAEADALLTSLARLSPGDVLLPHDARRHLQTRPRRPATPPPLRRDTAQRAPGRLELIHSFNLGEGPVWQAAIAVGDTLCVAGVCDSIVVARCSLTGDVELRRDAWPDTQVPQGTRLLMLAGRTSIHLFPIGRAKLPMVDMFERSDAYDPCFAYVGPPKGSGLFVVAASSGPLGQVWLIQSGDRQGPSLVCVSADGAVMSTRSIPLPVGVAWSDVATPIPIHATTYQVFLGAGAALLGLKRDETKTIETFEHPIVGLSGGGPYASPNLAVSLRQGAAVVRPGFGGSVVQCAESLSSPKLLITRAGFLVAADDTLIEAYQLDNRTRGAARVSLRATTPHTTGTPIAVLPTRHTDQFVLVTQEGEVSVFRLTI